MTARALPPVAILAGGLATRLRPVTETIPKALVAVAGQSFIFHQLALLQRQGASQVVLCVGHLGEMIQQAVGNGSTWNLSVRYSFDGPKLLGTAGAIKRALPLLGKTFFILYGDSYLDCDYQSINAAFRASLFPALMSVYRNNNQWDRSNVIYEKGRIIRYDKTTQVPEMHHIDYGLSMASAHIFDEVKDNEVADLANIYSQLASEGKLAGYEVFQRFYEIGTFAGLSELENKLSKEQNLLLMESWQCPLCNHAEREYLIAIHGFRVDRCPNCGLVFQSALRLSAKLATGTFELHGSLSDSRTEYEAAEAYIEALQQRQLSGNRLLIIAETDHPIAVVAEKAGYKVETHLNAQKADKTSLPDAYYDAAIIVYQVEKSATPLGLFSQVHSALKADGLVLTVVPSLDSWSARFFKVSWTEWRSENLFYFNDFTVQSSLLETGFAEITIQPDRRRYTLSHLNDRARIFPHTTLTRLIQTVYRLLPPNLRHIRVQLPSSGIIVLARRVIRRERPLLSIVMPVYNERATVVDTLNNVLNKTIQGVDKEIILVESNSTDGTRDLILTYEERPELQLVLEERPRGKGHAVRVGFEHAKGDFILIQDADSEYDVNDYDVLISALQHFRTAFVLGSRHSGNWKIRQFSDQPGIAAYFNLGHNFFTLMFNVLYGQHLKDPFTMYKVFRRDCLYGLSFECNRFDFDIELVAKLLRKGYSVLEIPVNYRSRSIKEGKKVSMFREPPTYIVAEVKYRFAPLQLKRH